MRLPESHKGIRCLWVPFFAGVTGMQTFSIVFSGAFLLGDTAGGGNTFAINISARLPSSSRPAHCAASFTRKPIFGCEGSKSGNMHG